MELVGTMGRIDLYPSIPLLPASWARCEGQVVNPGDAEALFRLLGSRFGGNGQTTFALPDLRGQAPIPGLAYQMAVAGEWPTTDPGGYYIGTIMLFPFTTVSTLWSVCEGQLLPIASNTALFAVLGVRFGGDGHATFALPDLRGKAPAGLQYFICVSGRFPSMDPDGGSDFPFPLGTTVLVASTVVPGGWLPCEGQSIDFTNPQNPLGLLFNSTLPDLRGKAPIAGLRYCTLGVGDVPRAWSWP